MLSNMLNLALVALALPLHVLGGGHNSPLLNRHHNALSKRADGHIDLYHRADNAKMSFYNVETGNAGSCGRRHTNGQFTVALNAGQMNSGLCFKTIRISYGGKSTVATISDTCPGCPWNGLDLTEGLFSFFAPHSVGIIYGDWEFTDAAPPPPPPPPRPTTTRIPQPPRPTTTWSPPPVLRTSTRRSSTRRTSTQAAPTTSSAPPPTTSTTPLSSSTPTSAAVSTSIDYSSGPASGLAIPTGTINSDPNTPQNLAELYQAFISLGGLAVAGANV